MAQTGEIYFEEQFICVAKYQIAQTAAVNNSPFKKC